MALLIDTHTLVWLAEGNPKLSRKARDAIFAGGEMLAISAVTAFELADLRERGRIPTSVDLENLLATLDITLLDFPADLWRFASRLPYIHGDPVDRMLVAHALATGNVLVTADGDMSRYPGVRTLW